MSKRVYYAVKWGGAIPQELVRWKIAERFGWTLEYVDALSMGDLLELYHVDDGIAKAR